MKTISNPNSSNKCNARRKTGTHINPEEKREDFFSFPLARLKSVYLRLPSKKVKDGTFNPRTKIRNSVLTKRRSHAECYCRENWKR